MCSSDLALAEQLRGQARRQFQRCGQGQARALQLRAFPRAFARQGRQLVTAQGDLFVEGVQLAMGFRPRGFGLAGVGVGADPGIQAAVGQVAELLPLARGGAGRLPGGPRQCHTTR